jgi:hypothetical protein
VKSLTGFREDIAAAELKAAQAKRGKGARAKGATFERDVAILLRRVWPAAKRGLGQARQGREVPDVDGTPYWIELKHRKARPKIQAAWEQAFDDSTADALSRGGGSALTGPSGNPRRPVAITRQNNGPILVTMALEDWLRLAELASL